MRHALPIILSAVLWAALAAPAWAAPDALLGALQRAEAGGALAPAQGVAYRDVLANARTVRDSLQGVRRREMAAAIAVAGSIAKRGQLTVGRMPVVFLTLSRNAQWWAANGPPAAGAPGGGFAGRDRRPRAPVQAPARSRPRGPHLVPGQRARLPVLPRPRAAAPGQRHLGAGQRAVRQLEPGVLGPRRGAARRAPAARQHARGGARVGVRVPDLRRPPAVGQRVVAGDGRAGADPRG